MSQQSRDEFADAMWQHMQTVNTACTVKINALRREISELTARDHHHAGEIWALEEKIQMMQLRWEAAQRAALNPPV